MLITFALFRGLLPFAKMISHRRAVLAALIIGTMLFFIYFRRNAGTQIYNPTYEANLEPSAPRYAPGKAKPASETYTRTLVLGRLQRDDISWIDIELPGLNTSVYVVDDDDPNARLRIPKNKGHEAMVYLTYIIDHYDTLPDTVLFFHPHKGTWHNNVLNDLDTAVTIRRLNDAHVARKGYFNSRCHHDPGCPDWLHLDRPEAEWDLIKKNEERYFTSKVWRELHPFGPLPTAISQPCCAQFAVSRERILAQPRSEYVRYRNWLLWTSLEDEISGRIMEYTWQYIFTGQSEFCPPQHECYCDGYGICYGGEAELANWLHILRQRELLDEDVQLLTASNRGESVEAAEKKEQSNKLNNELNRLTAEAMERGKDPKSRAVECGRPWQDGDGF
jgi:hypothetical protein